VTGASGFIGSRLCTVLAAAGAEVHGISRKARDTDGVRWWNGDLAEPGFASRVLAAVHPDWVFHLAGLPSGSRELSAVRETLKDDFLTTVEVLIAACEHGRPRVVLGGSMEEWSPEDPGHVPSSPYSAAKSAGSAYARMFHGLYDLPVVHLRIFMVYGPGQPDRTKLVPYTIETLLRGDAPQLSSGTRQVDWIYVDDVVHGLIAAALADGVEGQTLDLGSGTEVSIAELAELLAHLVGGPSAPSLGARPDRPLERRRVADVARARELMGWQPTTSLEDGLARTIRWLRDDLTG
jgi:nucleoside-diphosphate-sugar epimerase